jgi:hypothetical protein
MLRRLLLIAAIALTCGAVAACGDDDSGGPSPTPVASTTVWNFSGQLNAHPNLSTFSCTALQGYYQVLLVGELDGLGVSVFVFTRTTGALDYGNSANEVTVTVQRHSEDNTVNDLWNETAGKRGAAGTVTMNSDASGSVVNAVVPPGATGSGGATAPITISGEWDCPFAPPT